MNRDWQGDGRQWKARFALAARVGEGEGDGDGDARDDNGG